MTARSELKESAIEESSILPPLRCMKIESMPDGTALPHRAFQDHVQPVLVHAKNGHLTNDRYALHEDAFS